jgi:uncharacterized membrane protein
MEQYKLNWIRRHLDPDSMAKYQHMQEKKRERSSELRKDMIRHLSTLNDGVIAIFITVMMLGILIPPASGLILTFFGLFWYSWSVFLLLRDSSVFNLRNLYNTSKKAKCKVFFAYFFIFIIFLYNKIALFLIFFVV